MFGGTELAARIERAEVSLTGDSARAAATRRPSTGVFATPLAGGIAAWTGDGSPFNKVIGIGFAGPLEPAALDAVEAMFAERRAPVRVELSTLADPEIGRLLTARGYRLDGFENVLGCPLPARAAIAPGVDIAPTADLAAWLDVIVSAFAAPDLEGVPSNEEFGRDILEAVIGDMAATTGMRHYVARIAGEPAGAAGLRICDGIAQLLGAGTLPALRRRGVQSSLLAARLAAAAEARCEFASVATQPGSKSQANAQRLGFYLLYVRAVLVRDVTH